jgi:uncharacterized repeat protein (TIGR04002 family)
MDNSNMKHLRYLTTAGVFAALIFVSTYLLHVPTPFNGGYIHPGDTFIYLAACFLPTPYAAAAASIGAALSDTLTPNAMIYVPATIIIKAVMTLFFISRSDTIITRRHIVGIVLAGITGLFGYFIWESAWFGVYFAAVNVPFGAIQPLASGILFVLVGHALDKTNMKKRLRLG